MMSSGSILTVTFLRELTEPVPGRAFTFKRAHGVDTVAALTNAGYGLALVHICASEEFKHRKETNALA